MICIYYTSIDINLRKRQNYLTNCISAAPQVRGRQRAGGVLHTCHIIFIMRGRGRCAINGRVHSVHFDHPCSDGALAC
jgi:hypothetical protein